MEQKPMKILIIEDDVLECTNFKLCAQDRKDIDIVGITDSDIEGLYFVKQKRPEGIILDIELNNSKSGSTDALDFISRLKEFKLGYEPIVIVTTHINSKTTYDMLHRAGADLILYKDQEKYSSEYVLNKFISLRRNSNNTNFTISEEIQNNENRISDMINEELSLVGVAEKLKGKKYLHDAILYLIENGKDKNVMQYLINTYKIPSSTISNGMQTAIIHGWKATPFEDIEKYYKARVNYERGVPTPMEFIYYYVDKISKAI